MEQIVVHDGGQAMVQGGFDYSQWDNQAAQEVQQLAGRIHRRNLSMAQAYIDNGKDLIAAKERIPAGQWLSWLRDELGLSAGTASVMMRIARLFGHLSLAETGVAAAALDLLSRHDIPATIRNEAGRLLEAGEIVTRQDAIELVAGHNIELAARLDAPRSADSERRRRIVADNLALQIAELGFAVRNMQMALSTSYGVPFKSNVADALERLQTVADTLIPLVPQRSTRTDSTQGIVRLDSKSGYVGVHLDSRGKQTKWYAVIHARGKQQHIGVFGTAEEAARAYDAKARELYGDKARLNFPDEA